MCFATWPAPIAHKADRVDLQKQRSSAAFGRGLGIENVRLPEGLLERMNAERALVQEVPKSVAGFPVYEIVRSIAVG